MNSVAGERKDKVWVLAAGPTYNEALVQEALDGLTPHIGWLLVDAAEFPAAVTAHADHESVDPVVARFHEWARTMSQNSSTS
ncbi:MAG: hypothetical protein O6913_00820 [Chloroflexi bacterium]|nr:hypothetical protein [Chloroflexota bacterium]